MSQKLDGIGTKKVDVLPVEFGRLKKYSYELCSVMSPWGDDGGIPYSCILEKYHENWKNKEGEIIHYNRGHAWVVRADKPLAGTTWEVGA